MTVFGVKIKCGVPAALLLVAYVLLGQARILAIAFVALSLHELSHALVTRGLGYRVRSIELLPFGFVAKLEERIPRWDELVIAAAGPLFSIITASVCMAFESAFALGGVVAEFANINLSIALVNLIPVMPLDGGRICAALFGIAEEGSAQHIFRIVGIVLSALMTAGGVLLALSGNSMLLVLGLFLLMQNLTRKEKGFDIGKTLGRAEKLRRSGHARARYLAVDGHMSAGKALRLTGSDYYTVLLVLDENMHVVGEVDEARLLDAVTRLGAQTPLMNIAIRH